MSEALEPCPFCGSPAELSSVHPITDADTPCIVCTNAECPVVLFVELDDEPNAEEHAAMLWNTRAGARSEVA
jgi:hypothetical protein